MMATQRYCNRSDHNTLTLARALGAYRCLTPDEITMVEFATRRIQDERTQRWTDDETTRLVTYLNQGATMSEAGRRLGRSFGSVRKRVARITRNNVSIRMKHHG